MIGPIPKLDHPEVGTREYPALLSYGHTDGITDVLKEGTAQNDILRSVLPSESKALIEGRDLTLAEASNITRLLIEMEAEVSKFVDVPIVVITLPRFGGSYVRSYGKLLLRRKAKRQKKN